MLVTAKVAGNRLVYSVDHIARIIDFSENIVHISFPEAEKPQSDFSLIETTLNKFHVTCQKLQLDCKNIFSFEAGCPPNLPTYLMLTEKKSK